MYRAKEFKNRTTMKDYLKNYLNGEGFLEYCEKYTGYNEIWSCPLYDFNPAGYGKKYKYLYIIGKRITFEQAAGSVEKGKDRGKDEEEQKELERYMNQVCMKEKDVLLEKIKAVEKRYPNSFILSAGSCHVCRHCKRPKRGGCRYSDDIRCFIEFIGGNVGETAGDLLGIEHKWMKQKLPDYFTLITGILTDDPKVEI